MSLKLRSHLVFALLCALFILQGLWNLRNINEVNSASALIATRFLPRANMVSELMYYTARYRIGQGRYILSLNEGPEAIQSAAKSMKSRETDVKQTLEAYAKTLTPGETAAKLEVFKTQWADYSAKNHDMLAVAESGDLAQTSKIYRDFKKPYDDLAKNLEAMKKEQSILSNLTDAHAKKIQNDTNIFNYASMAIFSILIFIGAAFNERGIIRPIQTLSMQMRKLSNKSFDIEIYGLDRKDEIGTMSTAVQVFKENGLALSQLEQDKLAAEILSEQKRQDDHHTIAQELETHLNSVLDKIQHTTQALTRSASQMHENATDTAERAATVATSSEQTTNNVQSVASAAEELTASIAEIQHHAEYNANIASGAANNVQDMATQITQLESHASEVGSILDLITQIAAQTNLLALNATIESARAGDAGRGFAVVASEVKALANQTARATENIGTMLDKIRTDSRNAVLAIQSVSEAIVNVQQVSENISQAVEQQRHATQEIAHNVSGVASDARSVSNSIETVKDTAENSGKSAHSIQLSVQDLNEQSQTLKDQVHQLANRIRSAA